MNKCMFIGNLTRDPESRTTDSGVSMCTFSIAVNRNFAGSNGEREADFINIVTWRGLADNCSKYLTKGRTVCVVGRLQTRTYEDKDGNRRSAFDIVAEDVEFISRGNSDNNGERQPAPARSNGADKKPSFPEPIDDGGELPF